MSHLVAWGLAASVGVAPGAWMVLPPEPAGTPQGECWLGQAVALRLSRGLLTLGARVATADDGERALLGLGLPPGRPSLASMLRAAETLDVSFLVVGALASREERLTIEMHVLDLTRGAASAPYVVSGPHTSIILLIDQLAWELAPPGPGWPSRERFLEEGASTSLEPLRLAAEALCDAQPALRRAKLERAAALAPGDDTARVQLGRHLLAAGEPAAAADVLTDLADASPWAREARFALGAALLGAGRQRQALQVLEDLAAERPSPAVLCNLGVACHRSGTDAHRAVSLLRQAALESAGAVPVVFNLGWALLATGHPEEAAFWFREVAREQRTDQPAWLGLGRALRLLGRDAEAEHALSRLVGAEPDLVEMAAADLALRLERVLPSERLVELRSPERRRSAPALLHAAARLTDADPAEASRILAQAAYVDPYDALVHELLARAHRARGESQRALDALRMSLWCREDSGARAEMIGLLLEAGRREDAREEARRLGESQADRELARRLLGEPE